mmetsp:Transcript_55290/g.49791  ORF Transcript_55290/g.49791 Transcript_55290/m.49791 type:complete len:144 (-) Transcript_55290:224-655(-)
MSSRCHVCLKQLDSSTEKSRGRCRKCMNKKMNGSSALTSVALVTIGAAVGFVGGYIYSLWNDDNNETKQNQKEETKEDELLDTIQYDPDDDIGACPICYDRRVNIAITPCGHTLCKQCTDELPTKQCPMCQKAITNTQTIYIN